MEYRGTIPHRKVSEIYLQSIAGVAIHQSTQLNKIGSLGVIKLSEFIAVKLPVICSNYKLWQEIIEHYECGICVDPDNIEEIRDAIKYMLLLSP